MRALPFLLPLVFAACAETYDPYAREGVWRPTGANEHNLRAMAAYPEDVLRGTGAPGADGATAADAVARLRTDRVRPLPEVSTRGSGGGS